MRSLSAWALAWSAIACDGSSGVNDVADGGPTPLFPENFQDEFTVARDCRHSHEHDLRYIKVWANDLAKEPYATLSADVPYLPGATLVKLEYDDEDCTTLLGYTVMYREAPPYSPGTFNWHWQRLDAERQVLEDGPQIPRCIACHSTHCTPPRGAGFELTCVDDAAPPPVATTPRD
ncbi:MAG: hypothetical protein IV100_29555 [Myxococcales bacterium]|nr:hypothetical protein [Myxococcales bacterium]